MKQNSTHYLLITFAHSLFYLDHWNTGHIYTTTVYKRIPGCVRNVLDHLGLLFKAVFHTF